MTDNVPATAKPRMRLDPATLIAGMIASVRTRWRILLVVSLPMILLGVWTVYVHLSLKIDLWERLGEQPWVWSTLDLLLYLAMSTIWTVSIARVLLLDNVGRRNWFGLRWQRREWCTLFESFLVALATMLLIIPFFVAALIFGWQADVDVMDFTQSSTSYWSNLAIMLTSSAIASYGVCRWGLAIVGAAIDRRLRMGQSWDATVGTSLSIAGTLFVLLIPATAVQTLIDLELPDSSAGFRVLLIVAMPIQMTYFFGVQALVLCEAYRKLVVGREAPDIVTKSALTEAAG